MSVSYQQEPLAIIIRCILITQNLWAVSAGKFRLTNSVSYAVDITFKPSPIWFWSQWQERSEILQSDHGKALRSGARSVLPVLQQYQGIRCYCSSLRLMVCCRDRLPSVSVPVLSNTIWVALERLSRTCPRVIRIPFSRRHRWLLSAR